MKKQFPLISIVIATYNSSKTLPLVLDSIRKQIYPQKKVEILIVDGGSKDKTLDIATSYNCKIINNPRIEPVNAKLLGYSNAKGKYIIFLDADEVIVNPKSLALKFEVFQYNSDIKAVIWSGYTDPKGSSFLRSYTNEFGDPFSFFMYRSSKNYKYFLPYMVKRNPIISSNRNFLVLDFARRKNPILMELGAAGSMIDLNYTRKEFSKFTSEIFAHLFQILISKGVLIGITKKDSLMHFSSDNFKTYISKLRWRIKNNIFYKEEMGVSGFGGREKYQPGFFRYLKYLFIPYAFLIVFPLIDASWLSFTRRRISYLLHLPLTIYTANLILYYYFLKIVGVKLQLKNYDESKIIINKK